MAMYLPLSGGVACPYVLSPQQIREPSSRSAQAWESPPLTVANLPPGGVVCPCESLPQHTIVPSCRSPQAWLAPMLMLALALGMPITIGVDVAIGVIVGVAVGRPTVGADVAVGVGVAIDAGGIACPDPFQPQQTALPSCRKPHV